MGEQDIWHRPITNTRHIDKKTGKLKHAALKKKIEPPENPRSPWKSEVSGRLRSIVIPKEKVREHAEALARMQRTAQQARGESGSEFKFVAVAHLGACQARTWLMDKCKILYDPRMWRKKGDFDLAHANLVFGTKPPEKILSALDDVISELGITFATDLDNLPVARCPAPWTFRLLRWFFGEN